MESDRIKWDSRYAGSDSYLGRTPSPFLEQQIGLVKGLAPGVRALDIACGEGRNSIFLAQHGFRVTGLDISGTGIDRGRKLAGEAGLEIDFRTTDLDDYTIIEEYDLIINFNFLLRPLITQCVQALSPRGLMLFESQLATSQLLLRHNPAYLLDSGELWRIFSGFDGRILHNEEIHKGEFPTARLIFQKA